jgi:hypothetical protein
MFKQKDFGSKISLHCSEARFSESNLKLFGMVTMLYEYENMSETQVQKWLMDTNKIQSKMEPRTSSSTNIFQGNSTVNVMTCFRFCIIETGEFFYTFFLKPDKSTKIKAVNIVMVCEQPNLKS